MLLLVLLKFPKLFISSKKRKTLFESTWSNKYPIAIWLPSTNWDRETRSTRRSHTGSEYHSSSLVPIKRLQFIAMQAATYLMSWWMWMDRLRFTMKTQFSDKWDCKYWVTKKHYYPRLFIHFCIAHFRHTYLLLSQCPDDTCEIEGTCTRGYDWLLSKAKPAWWSPVPKASPSQTIVGSDCLGDAATDTYQHRAQDKAC